MINMYNTMVLTVLQCIRFKLFFLQPETSGEVIPMEEFVVKTTSAVTVKTRGTSPVTEASSYVGKGI